MSKNSVPMASVETFVRQLGHDWRNSLNNLDLHLSGLRTVSDPLEREHDLNTVHELVQKKARQLASVSRRISTCKPQMIPYPVGFFVEDLQDRLKKNLGDKAGRFEWQTQITGRKINVDFDALASGLEEVFANALHFTPGQELFPVRAETSTSQMTILLGETKLEDPRIEIWSDAPALRSSARGHYGLGLYHLRQVLEAHEGEVAFSFSPENRLLQTSIRLPLLAAL